MPNRIYVWDLFVRLFHWSLVAGFAANAFFTDEESKLHHYVGYAVAALIAARLLWGLFGSKHARFSDFWPSPLKAIGQLRDMITGRRHAHAGHSPLGALMIYNLLLTMAAIATTGYMMTTVTWFGIEWVEEAHEALRHLGRNLGRGTHCRSDCGKPQIARQPARLHANRLQDHALRCVMPTRHQSRQLVTLAALIVLQAACALFFARDVINDILDADAWSHVITEVAATISLAVGLIVQAIVLRKLTLRHARMEQGLAVARGSLSDVMENYFETWKLSPAEQDVAAFTIKGYSIAEIAKLRGSAEATIKAQLNAIYRKADVQGRAQLVSVLVEDLLREPLVKG